MTESYRGVEIRLRVDTPEIRIHALLECMSTVFLRRLFCITKRILDERGEV